jgi:hypothetical protein
MRVLFVGDVHGHDQWHEPVADALARSCHVVFLGDYFDSFTIDGVSIYDNMTDILELKKKYPDRITLLLGNHEYVYMMGSKVAGTTGASEIMAHDYYLLLNSNWEHFDLAWGYRSGIDCYLLATHAGLTNEYFRKFILPELEDKEGNIAKLIGNSDLLLHEKLNFFKDKFTLLWELGMRCKYPMGPGSIIWADKIELIRDPYRGIDQIVGHTAGYFIDVRNSNSNTLYFVNLKEFLTVGALMIEL